tara:strand:+ start:247 stop:666 length:420 start_codon:yes stop_codon:yes gene_type:complete
MARNRKLQNLQTTNMIADAAVTATAGQMTMVYQMPPIEGGATQTVSLVVDRKISITEVKVILLDDGGANGNVVQLKNGSTAITDAIVVGTAVVNAVVREGQLGILRTVAKGGTLNLVATDAGSNDIPPMTIIITAHPAV